MGISLESAVDTGLIDELAKCFRSAARCKVVLIRSGFKSSRAPLFGGYPFPYDYWLDICELVANGTPPGCLERLFCSASLELESNPVFRPFRIFMECPSDNTILTRPNLPARSLAYLAELLNEYDAFVSYSRRDHEAVLQLREQLVKLKVKPWMDVWNMPAGESYQTVIEKVLRSVKATLVCVGPDGLGPWQRVEVEAAMDLHVYGNKKVIPVSLPDASITSDDFPLFLKTLHGFALADDNAYNDVIVRLASEIRLANALT